MKDKFNYAMKKPKSSRNLTSFSASCMDVMHRLLSLCLKYADTVHHLINVIPVDYFLNIYYIIINF